MLSSSLSDKQVSLKGKYYKKNKIIINKLFNKQTKKKNTITTTSDLHVKNKYENIPLCKAEPTVHVILH